MWREICDAVSHALMYDAEPSDFTKTKRKRPMLAKYIFTVVIFT